jgi:hypothetical protein
LQGIYMVCCKASIWDSYNIALIPISKTYASGGK